MQRQCWRSRALVERSIVRSRTSASAAGQPQTQQRVLEPQNHLQSPHAERARPLVAKRGARRQSLPQARQRCQSLIRKCHYEMTGRSVITRRAAFPPPSRKLPVSGLVVLDAEPPPDQRPFSCRKRLRVEGRPAVPRNNRPPIRCLPTRSCPSPLHANCSRNVDRTSKLSRQICIIVHSELPQRRP